MLATLLASGEGGAPSDRLDDLAYGGDYRPGAPVVLEDLADALAGSVLRLLVVALVVGLSALPCALSRRAPGFCCRSI